MIFYPLNEARMKKMQGELQVRQAGDGSAHLGLDAAILDIEQRLL
jgi:Na+/melibiose symporter-like transporter